MSDPNVPDPAQCVTQKARQYLSGPQVFFAQVAATTNGQGDVVVKTPFPCNAFMVVSRKGGTENNSIFFHLTPLNKTYTSANVASVATGFEQWISMNTLPATGPNFLSVIRFKELINQFYLDIGGEGGAGPITIACFTDDAMQVTGGLYT